MERISLCDPAGNSFTIANQSKATGVDKSANSVDSNQFLRVYLPTTAENEMGQFFRTFTFSLEAWYLKQLLLNH